MSNARGRVRNISSYGMVAAGDDERKKLRGGHHSFPFGRTANRIRHVFEVVFLKQHVG